MANTSNTNKTSDFVELQFDGYDSKVKAKNDFENKVKSIKGKISQSITKNINYENGKSELNKSFRILEDTDTHTVINLRCGSKKIFQNTTKLGQYSHVQILNSLQGMLNSGKLDEYVVAYANGKPMVEKTAKKKKKKATETAPTEESK